MAKKAPTHPHRPQVLAFLSDCKENPDDDTPRLILADWLEDHDDARGEFVRLQCLRSQATGDRSGLERLPEREKELLDQHGSAWLGVLAEKGISVRHRRGMIEAYSTPRKLLSKRLAGLGEHEPLAWVDSLRLSEMTPADVTSLAGSPHWTCLSSLGLGGLTYYADQLIDPATIGRGKGDWTGLATVPVLSRVRDLDLHSLDIGTEGVRALGSDADLHRLRTLHLGSNNLGDPGAIALTAIASLPGLKRLDLNSNRMRGDGIAAIAEWSALAGVEFLNLNANYLGEAGIAALAASPHLGAVRELRLRAVDYPLPESYGPARFGPRGAIALAGATHLRSVQHLQLTDQRIGPEGGTALAQSDAFPNLIELGLGGNAIGDAGAIALARSPWTRNLQVLTLRFNGIGNRGAEALAESPHLVNLREMNFRANRDATPEALARLQERFGPIVLIG